MKRFFNEYRDWILIIGLILVSLVSGAVFVDKGVSYLEFKKKWEVWADTSADVVAENDRAYKELLHEQASRSGELVSWSETGRIYPRAVGDQRIHIVLVKPSSVPLSGMGDLLDVLRSDREHLFQEEDVVFAGFKYLDTYLSEQARRYGVDLRFDVQVHGVYDMDDLTKVGDPMQIWGKDPFAMLQLRDDFENLLEGKVGNVGDDPVVFLYFDNSYEMGTEEIRYSFYEYKKFRSFAAADVGRAYVNVYDFSPSFSADLMEVVIHENLHLYGAVDHYIESASGACSSRGRGMVSEAFVPQTTGDIMCLFVENPEGVFQRGSLKKGNLVVNEVTASDIGWIQ